MGPALSRYTLRALWASAALVALLGGTAVQAGPAEEEEVDLDALTQEDGAPAAGAAAATTRVPEHEYDRRLLAFPMLLVLILAWNVKWKKNPPQPKGQR